MDYVAKRDHSEKELRTKLKAYCEAELIDQAIVWAKEQNWLAAPDVLKEKFADQLHRRGKGIRTINQKLKAKGLPSTKSDFETEIVKARKLVFAKWSSSDFNGLDFKEAQKLKAKIMRFLIARGFETDVVGQILKVELKAKGNSHDDEF
jgi:regulatory protein